MTQNEKYELYKEYLTKNKEYIDFNGVDYTLLNDKNEVIFQCQSPNEMTAYILGYQRSQQKCDSTIEEIMRINNENIEAYEKALKELKGKDDK